MSPKYIVYYNGYSAKWIIAKVIYNPDFEDSDLVVVQSFDDLANCIYAYLDLIS